jgi:hypothetical protein
VRPSPRAEALAAGATRPAEAVVRAAVTAVAGTVPTVSGSGPGVSRSEAARTVAARLDDLPPIGLADLVATADLQRRYDEKYVVHLADLVRVLARLGPAIRVLEVDGRRTTAYDTQYLDTPELRTYRDHVQGRRRRYKVRTRSYGDVGPTMLEVKLKGHRGSTIKHRLPRTGHGAEPLLTDERSFVAAALWGAYGWSAPPSLVPSARLRFLRATLVDVEAGERLTIDRGLAAEVAGQQVWFADDRVIVEVKSPVLRGATRRRLLDLGLRRGRISKYGVAIAAVRSDVPSAAWRRAVSTLAPSPDARPLGTDLRA